MNGKIKRVFACMVSCLMLLNMQSFAAETIQDDEGKIYYEMLDFQKSDNAFTYPTEKGKTDSDYIYSRNGGNASVYNSNGYSYLNYFATGENTNHGMQAVKRFMHTYTAEDKTAYFKFTARAGGEAERRIWFNSGNGTDIYFVLSKTGTNAFEFTGTKIQTVSVEPFVYSDNEWHEFEFVFNLEDGYVKLFVDNKAISTVNAPTLSSTPYNIPLKSGFQLYEARFSATVRTLGWNIEDMQISNNADIMPGVTKATYREIGSKKMLTLSANGECEIKYAIAATRKDAVAAFHSGAATFSGAFELDSSKPYIAAQAVNSAAGTTGPLAVVTPVHESPNYICNDFSDFEDGVNIPANSYGKDYKGFSMDNYGNYAKVYNNGRDSYIIHTSTAETNAGNANSAKRLVRVFDKAYSSGNATVRFSWKTKSTKRKDITVGPITLNMTESGDFMLRGYDYPSDQPSLATAFIERFDTCADGNWHDFEFDFNFDDSYANIYVDGEQITPSNCYWTQQKYGSKPAGNIPLADNAEVSIAKFCSYDKDEWFMIDDFQASNFPEKMPTKVFIRDNAGTATLSADFGEIQYAVGSTAAEALAALKNSAQAYTEPFRLTSSGLYIAARTYESETDCFGPVKISGPISTGGIYNIRYTDAGGNGLGGELSSSEAVLKFRAEAEGEEPLSFMAVTGLYTEDGKLIKTWVNSVLNVNEGKDFEFELSGISQSGYRQKLRTLFLSSLNVLKPVHDPYSETLKNVVPEFSFENGLEGWTAESGDVYVTNRGYYESDGSEITEKNGSYFLTTAYTAAGGYAPSQTGIAVSPVINLKRNVITFVASGGDSGCYVALFDEEGNEIKKSVLENSRFERIVWDMSEFSGKNVYIKLFDESSACGASIDAVRMVDKISDENIDLAAAEGYYSGYCGSLGATVTARDFIIGVVRASGNASATDEECVSLAKSGNIRVGDTFADAGRVKIYREADEISLDEPLSRGNAALILSRLYDRDSQGDARRADPDNSNRERYYKLISDYNSISSDTIKTAVVDVFALGLMTAENGKFRADENITGAEAAGALVRAFNSSECYVNYVNGDGIFVPTVFGSHMVIQRDKPIHIWGQGKDGESVNISLTSDDNEVSVHGTATVENGRWEAVLSPVSNTDKVYMMTIKCGAFEETYTDILVGEVWLIAGQSNMQTPVNAYMNTDISGNIRAEGNDAGSYTGKIRYFTQAHSYSNGEKYDVRRGAWKECNTANVWNFSATGYMFGRNLYDMLNVPIGLVYAAQGSTGIQTWMSQSAIEADESVRQRVYENNASAAGSSGKAPSKYYNAMVNPLQGLDIGGILWYQGESNAASDGAFYENLLRAHINGWRSEFYNGEELPFVFMQLAPYSALDYTGVREGMRKVCESMDNVAMAVQIDSTDDAANPQPIHPYNKALVGERLAKAAFGMVYGGGEENYISPSFVSAAADGGEVTVTLKNIGGGIKTLGSDASTAFMIAGADGNYVQAEAEITGENTVKVWSSSVSEPKYVRYAWGRATVYDSSQNSFLFSGTDLPLGPFEAEINR